MSDLATPPPLCRTCHLELTPSGKPGRPRVTHPGECARLYRNRTDLDRRIAAYYVGTSPAPDRSDAAPAFVRHVGAGEGADALADGFSVMQAPPYKGRRLMAAVEAYEAGRRAERYDTRVRTLAALEGVYAEPPAPKRLTADEEIALLAMSQNWDWPLEPLE